MPLHDRRNFFRQALAFSAASMAKAATGTKRASSEDGEARKQSALQMRLNAAMAESQQPIAEHPTNGDEERLPGFIGNFTKGLPHTQMGEVQPGAYETLLHAISTGKQADFESISRGSGAKFVN